MSELFMRISPWFIIKRKKTKKTPIVLFRCATACAKKKKCEHFAEDSNAGTCGEPLIKLWQCDTETQRGDNQSNVQQL